QLLDESISEAVWPKAGLNVAIECQIEHLHMVLVDASKVKRAMSNVIENALDATGPSGRIWVKTKEVEAHEGTFAQVTIGNSGSFIEKGLVRKIFDPFYTN